MPDLTQDIHLAGHAVNARGHAACPARWMRGCGRRYAAAGIPMRPTRAPVRAARSSIVAAS